MELDFKINLPKTQMTNPTPLKLSFILDFNNVDNKMTYTISQNKAAKIYQINKPNNSEVEQRNEIYINSDNINNNNSINMTNIYSESNENIKELDKKDFDNKNQFTNINNNNEKQKNDNSIRDISKSFRNNKDLEAGEVIDLMNRNQKEKKIINRESNDSQRGKNNFNNNNYNRNRRSFENRNNQYGKYEKLFLKDNDKDKDKEKFNYKKQI